MCNSEQIDKLIRILNEEYGIKNEAELDAALQSQPKIDLSPFCNPVKYKEEE